MPRHAKKKRRSILLLIASILGVLCLIYTWSYIGNLTSTAPSGSDAYKSGYQIGMAIAMNRILPHQVLATIATIFCCLGWLLNARWSALVAGILYAVAIALMFSWFYFVIIQMVLCFVAFARMKKSN